MRLVFLPVVLAIAFGGFAAASASAPGTRITQSSIGGVKLGLTRKQYTRLLGRPSFTTRFGHSLVRLAFEHKKLAVYVSRSGRGVAVLTSEERYRTAKGVGPCSAVPALRRAYKGLVTTRRAGHTVAYRLKNLVFASPSGKVGAVMLARRGFPVGVAVNAGQCGGGEEE
jgi:hypothetical protein